MIGLVLAWVLVAPAFGDWGSFSRESGEQRLNSYGAPPPLGRPLLSTLGNCRPQKSGPASAPIPRRSYQRPVSGPVNPPSRSYQVSVGGGDCGRDKFRNALGQCVGPEFVRNVYTFQEPRRKSKKTLSRPLPKPRVKVNLVVIRANEDEPDDEPVIVPPEIQKTVVLVLRKEDESGERKVIELPAGPEQKPEVFFIDYEKEDDTPLPGGITLREALSLAASSGGREGGGERQSDAGLYGY